MIRNGTRLLIGCACLYGTVYIGRATSAVEPAAVSKKNAASAEKIAEKGVSSIEGYQTNNRWREGTKLVNLPGVFQLAGDRVQFTGKDGKLQLLLLENLMAERIARTVQESSEPLNWQVSGTITEYRNTNYLLALHAVALTKHTAAAQSPADDAGGKSPDSPPAAPLSGKSP